MRPFVLVSIALSAGVLAPLSCATSVDVEQGEGGGGEGGEGGQSSPSSSGVGSTTSSGGGKDAGPDAPPAACEKAADCAALSDLCNVGVCVNGLCQQSPANDFAACDDGLFCTQDDICKEGQCVGGTSKFCPSVGSCLAGACNEATDQCETKPGNEGAQCDDGDACTAKSTCQSGTCLGGSPVDCSFLNGSCVVGVCNSQGGCVQAPANDGAACDDGLYCTINDMCTGGLCGGEPNTCAAPGDVCLIGSCNEAQDSCVSVPGPNGVACNDQSACTSGEVCSNGLCGGGMPVNQGGACDDQKECTAADVCSNGMCAGTPIVACQNGDGCCAPGCTLAQDDDCNALGSPTYDASQTFIDGLQSTTMMLAWDGTDFWSCSGGSNSDFRLARYSAAGVVLNTYQPGIDFRAVFVKGDGTSPVYARGYSSNQILVQTAPGVFGGSVTLNGGALDAQSGIVYDADTSNFVGFNAGVVLRWTAMGALVGSTVLVDFGVMNGENQYPQNRGIIARGGLYLTYSNGVLSSWNAAGQRQKTSVLNGAGVGFDSHFSLSYAAGKVWIIDAPGQTWRGYDVGL